MCATFPSPYHWIASRQCISCLNTIPLVLGIARKVVSSSKHAACSTTEFLTTYPVPLQRRRQTRTRTRTTDELPRHGVLILQQGPQLQDSPSSRLSTESGSSTRSSPIKGGYKYQGPQLSGGPHGSAWVMSRVCP